MPYSETIRSTYARVGTIRTDENDDGLLVSVYVPKADLSTLFVEHEDVCGCFERLGVDCR